MPYNGPAGRVRAAQRHNVASASDPFRSTVSYTQSHAVASIADGYVCGEGRAARPAVLQASHELSVTNQAGPLAAF